jgi:hypothetical protein
LHVHFQNVRAKGRGEEGATRGCPGRTGKDYALSGERSFLEVSTSSLRMLEEPLPSEVGAGRS